MTLSLTPAEYAILRAEPVPLAEGTAERLATEWNTLHDVGTPVRYWPGYRVGDGYTGQTRTPAWVVCGNPVVSVTGWAGGIALTHVDVDKDRGHDN